uniref:Uncharacterized protein n=1 Tax=Alexandrium monilatum TaxID=311494 RepID=A0A7S4T7J3_9DINO
MASWEEAFEFPHAKDVLVFAAIDVGTNDVTFTFEVRGPGGEIRATLHPSLKFEGLWGLLEVCEATREALAQCLLGLGMAVLSYAWMGFCTPVVELRVQPRLTEAQLAFWRDVYLRGLREHFFVNGIADFGGEGAGLHLEIRQSDASTAPVLPAAVSRDADGEAASGAGDLPAVLVPLGAGKDSLVAWEMLGRCRCTRRWFFLEGEEGEFQRCWRYAELAEASGGGSGVLLAAFAWCTGDFERARNARYELSGHLWACVVGFAAALTALAHGLRFVAVGNERSANLGNGVWWDGEEVNHQYDKSFPFEAAVHDYMREHCGGLHYFSMLMPLWDVQVGLIFAKLCEPYVPLIISCNMPAGRDKSRWCCACHKCTFVAALLSAFLPAPGVRAVFGDSPLDSTACLECLEELVGHRAAPLPAPARAALAPGGGGHCTVGADGWTPLECVGGRRETLLAIRLARLRTERSAGQGSRLPRLFRLPLGDACVSMAAQADEASPLTALLVDWGQQHLLPAWAEPAVRACLEESLQMLREEALLEFLSQT